MNLWLLTALALLLGFVPCGLVLARARTMERFVAMQMAGLLTPLILFLLALGFGQPSFADLSLAVAVLSLPAGLLFAHFFERWL
jgi:multisubunit Na+/H+ antiporter MnhF subunit